ncbi:MAG: hypothetical protein V6Z89_08260 [Desulfobacter sp.]
MKKAVIAALIVGLVGIGYMAFATEQGATRETAAQETMAAGTDALAEGPINVRGVVEKSESGLALFNGKETYLLKGGEEVREDALEGMIGKLVKISGDLEKDDKGAWINVKEAVVAN